MRRVQIHTVVAPVFATRCSVLVAPDGACVVVDAGAGAAGPVLLLVEEHAWRPQAVLATHGHADHVWDAAALCDAWGVPLVLHARDAYRLDDPFGTLGVLDPRDPTGPLTAALAAAGADVGSWTVPARVEPFGGDEPSGRTADVDLDLGGVRLRARHAPGHTEGSTLYLLDGVPAAAGAPVVLSGDVLFAGGVGRTDLPGGDAATMARTLAQVVAVLPPDAPVLPGHGPATDVRTELATNPWLPG
ncbi:glyoxylase-like metal-dependent hydrolase (beta-lactamase superfamily II) [Cellulomonas sp. SLBN-39]|nr:glyoxylase-like metal-dependent hydrolase (beta-lactamase superfamily II) [Cellulomonas sp. SLBN-39]